MSLQRYLEKSLDRWRQESNRKPLLIRGARQVGKSFLVEAFAKQHFANTVVINFEIEPQYKQCFVNLNPKDICNAIQVISQKDIIPGKTLLFLDEIQDCPDAIRSLRYFKEQMPDLHVIGAGSLLELVLRNAEFRMPVGRVAFLYLYPLSFKEFIHAINPEAISTIETCDVNNPVPVAIHEHLLKQVRLYMLLGGMPEVIAHYVEHQDIKAVQALQSSIITTYENDFGHYAPIADPKYLRICFNKAPMMIGQQIKYNKIDPDVRSLYLKSAISALEAAGILQRVVATSAKGLPLDATINEKKFKLNYIDIGLVKRFNQLDEDLILEEDIMLLNNGALAEQYVGQELLAYAACFEKPKLYFWARDGSNTAEIDYIERIGSDIFPLEVKAGKIGRLKSLKQYQVEHDDHLCVRISEQPLALENNILSVPLYMVSELGRLLKSI